MASPQLVHYEKTGVECVSCSTPPCRDLSCALSHPTEGVALMGSALSLDTQVCHSHGQRNPTGETKVAPRFHFNYIMYIPKTVPMVTGARMWLGAAFGTWVGFLWPQL